uniref:Transmembrane protein 237 homolog (inferred by orthology to a C. elegans protein) n=1 Tax=Nippostrongylus brasiliensis TaxID=27835 RepID=A0A0N4YSL2_NIPBR
LGIYVRLVIQETDNGERRSEGREDNDDATTYSGASTSRLVSTPVESKTSDDSISSTVRANNEVSDFHAELSAPEMQEPREIAEQSTLRSVFNGIVRRRTAVGENEPAHTVAKPEPSHRALREQSVVYVEKDGKFLAMKKNAFERQQEIGVKKPHEDVFSTVINFISSKHPDVGVAYSVQNNFHNISMIMQGFLSGLTVAEAVFAFSFASEELLMSAYRWLSLPVHVVFLTCFMVGCVASVDRTGFYGWKITDLKRTLSHGGIIGIVLWSLGLVASAACIRFDEALAPVVDEVALNPELLTLWRVCSAVRAVCASAAWLHLALRPDSNVLGATIKRTAIDEMLQRNVDLLEQVPVEFRGQLSKMLSISQ